ncbi:AMP-binding protein [Cupriavidus pauculus]|jgi:crotonobetaine/carnitine-CoA ligase|uniref:AMP-binding protein n=1 Tax=Cupriavidus pauculus TaxID=82633 RepID=UPI0030FBCF60
MTNTVNPSSPDDCADGVAQHIDIDPVGNETISALLARRARETPEHVYCYFGETALTVAELDRKVNQVANGLSARGLQPGDRVALMLPSHPDHIVAIFALARLGLVRVPVNVHLRGAALEHLFEQFAPHGLVADAEYAAEVASLGGRIDACTVIWRGEHEGQDEFGAFAELSAEPPALGADAVPTADTILALTPSSGTTGAPKGVLKSDRTLRAGPMGILRLTGAQPNDVFLLWESLHHGAGVAVIISALIGRTTLAMVERFSASRFWDDVRRHGVTHIHYLGSVVPMLLKQPPRDNDREHKVKVAWGGGCPPELWSAFSQRFGVEMREGYGLSEMITFVTVNPAGPAGSVGKPLDYFDVDLTDDEGRSVPVGEPGEIVVRARVPGLEFLGYFRNPEAQATAMRGDWFCTGDLARRDEKGFLYFAGRKKDTVRRRGINISAWEVERVIGEHPDVEECALVGVPSDLGEDELKIFIRPRSEAPGVARVLDPMALVQWCETRMPYFQIPRYIAFIDEFPKTPTQRIQKKLLSRDLTGVWDLEQTGYKIGKKTS